ncbi:MAG TPA: hypothetical protein VK192_12020 [Sphingomicrobium sp.]|nr:hypothetical protein [Sphingomicrobium sp.]
MKPIRPATERREELYAALRGLAADVSASELPELLEEIERAKWTALLRVAAARPPAAGHESLLTAEQVAGRLQVSEAQVYRLPKAALR